MSRTRDEAQVTEAHRLYGLGLSTYAIAAHLCVDPRTVQRWLDGITGPKEYQKHGTGGDAKGQPTQTNTISHGSPWLLIRKQMVGAAFD